MVDDSGRRRDGERDQDSALLLVTGEHRRRLLTIVAWTLAFFVGSLAVGFVLTAVVLITGLLVLHKERLAVVLAGAAVSLGASYLLVVVVLEQPLLSGWLLW